MGRCGRTVEIDESVFASVGKDGCKVWVLGFYERGSKDQRAIYVKDRTTETLTQVILENVELGAEIYTDFWRGYNGLKHHYQHRIVNKAQKGSGTSEFQTTNHVESMWSLIKRYFNAYNCFNSPYLQMFLDEALWRMQYKIYQDRIDFLVQLNTYHNYISSNDAKSIQPLYQNQKVGYKTVEEQFQHEMSALEEFSIQTLQQTSGIVSELEQEANSIISSMYGRIPGDDNGGKVMNDEDELSSDDAMDQPIDQIKSSGKRGRKSRVSKVQSKPAEDYEIEICDGDPTAVLDDY